MAARDASDGDGVPTPAAAALGASTTAVPAAAAYLGACCWGPTGAAMGSASSGGGARTHPRWLPTRSGPDGQAAPTRSRSRLFVTVPSLRSGSTYARCEASQPRSRGSQRGRRHSARWPRGPRRLPWPESAPPVTVCVPPTACRRACRGVELWRAPRAWMSVTRPGIGRPAGSGFAIARPEAASVPRRLPRPDVSKYACGVAARPRSRSARLLPRGAYSSGLGREGMSSAGEAPGQAQSSRWSLQQNRC